MNCGECLFYEGWGHEARCSIMGDRVLADMPACDAGEPYEAEVEPVPWERVENEIDKVRGN